MKHHIEILFFVLLLLGCGVSLQSVDASKRTRQFYADYLSTFNAALTFCSQAGYTISYADKNSGVINTDYKTTPDYAGLFEKRVRVSFHVSPGSELGTMVTATIVAEFYMGGKFKTWETIKMSQEEAEREYRRVLSSVQSFLAVPKEQFP